MADRIRYFLWIDGVRGDSTDRAHPGWIPIRSFQWGVRPGGNGVGGGKVGETLPEVDFESPADRSGPVLMMACATGRPLGSAKLEAVSSSSGNRMYLTMKDVLVSSFAPSGEGNRFSFNVAHYEVAPGLSNRSGPSR